jgi:hypothetical protein
VIAGLDPPSFALQKFEKSEKEKKLFIFFVARYVDQGDLIGLIFSYWVFTLGSFLIKEVGNVFGHQ